MTRDEAIAILRLPEDQAVEVILEIAQKAEQYDQLCGGISPGSPSGMQPIYLKPPGKKRKKKPGRKTGHPGASRKRPAKIDHFKEHTLDCCPECENRLGPPVKRYTRYTEDIPPVTPEVTEHTVYGYWCGICQKIVYPPVTDALPNAMIGLGWLFLPPGFIILSV